MDDHVGKPFRQDALLSAIDRWTSNETEHVVTSDLVCSVFDEMLYMTGHERMIGLLAMLAEELTHRFGPSSLSHERKQIADNAHAMVSAASMVGFASLAARCREVEAACASNEDYTVTFAALRAHSSETIAAIEILRSDLASKFAA